MQLPSLGRLSAKARDRWWGLVVKVVAPRLLQEKFSDDAIVQFHRRLELVPPLLILCTAAFVSLIPDLGGQVNDSFMPAVAQILPVLFLAQIVESNFQARRLIEEIGASHRQLVWRYMGTSAKISFFTFIAGEAAALYATAKGVNTFYVVASLMIGALLAWDMSLSYRIRAGDGLSLTQMVRLQQQAMNPSATGQETPA